MSQQDDIKTFNLYCAEVMGYRGVTYYERDNNWTARVSVNNRIKFLGRFKNRVDAAVVRDSYVITHNLGLPLNFPQPINCIQAIMEAS